MRRQQPTEHVPSSLSGIKEHLAMHLQNSTLVGVGLTCVPMSTPWVGRSILHSPCVSRQVSQHATSRSSNVYLICRHCKNNWRIIRLKTAKQLIRHDNSG